MTKKPLQFNYEEFMELKRKLLYLYADLRKWLAVTNLLIKRNSIKRHRDLAYQIQMVFWIVCSIPSILTKTDK